MIPEYIVIHTTDSRGGTVQLIDDDHRQHRCFAMIGYHWLIRNGRAGWAGGEYVEADDGRIERGRPEGIPGAHAHGVNTRSIGIALVAHRDHPVTERQIASLDALVRDAMRRWLIPVERVIGHREVSGAPSEKQHCPLLDMDALRARLVGRE